jgi:hypothetical protein
VADVERHVVGEARLESLQGLQPFTPSPVREVGVHAVVDDVAGEHGFGVQPPQGVDVRLPWSQLLSGEGDAADVDLVPVVHELVGKGPRGRPLGAHHRADDGVLHIVVPADDRVDRSGGDDRNVVVADDISRAGVVVRMRVRYDNAAMVCPLALTASRTDVASETVSMLSTTTTPSGP